MLSVLQLFEVEFLDYCKSRMPFGSLMFGNMDYDFDLIKKEGQWWLYVYEVCLDHYGMPYRNNLEFSSYDVSNYFD